MDFLTLLIVYCLIFVVGSLCILYRDAKVLNTGPFGALRNLLIEVNSRTAFHLTSYGVLMFIYLLLSVVKLRCY